MVRGGGGGTGFLDTDGPGGTVYSSHRWSAGIDGREDYQ
jgi:hypothetical protein